MDREQILMLIVIGVLVLIAIILFVAKHKLKNKPNKDKFKTDTKNINVKPMQVEVEEKEKPVKALKTEEKKLSTKKAVYHISQNKEEKSARYKEWRVRKRGSQKTIKYFLTQKEAIEFAEQLAQKAGGSIVIHKKTGEIRKQNYS